MSARQYSRVRTIPATRARAPSSVRLRNAVCCTRDLLALAELDASLPNTRDKLRGAHPSTKVLGGSGTVATGSYQAPPRLHPPLVSFIALFGGAWNSAMHVERTRPTSSP